MVVKEVGDGAGKPRQELAMRASGEDMLIVDGNPLTDLGVLMNPEKNLKFIMKDGTVYKNQLTAAS